VLSIHARNDDHPSEGWLMRLPSTKGWHPWAVANPNKGVDCMVIKKKKKKLKGKHKFGDIDIK
jgi:hypothetical protein